MVCTLISDVLNLIDGLIRTAFFAGRFIKKGVFDFDLVLINSDIYIFTSFQLNSIISAGNTACRIFEISLCMTS